MAVVKFGPIITGARGTIGGTIFSANHSGAFARHYSRGSNPRSQAQTNQRRTLASFAQSWAALDASTKDDWNLWAADPAQECTNALGEAYYLSGFQWFIRLNTNLINTGYEPFTTAPTLPAPPTPSSLVLTLDLDPYSILLEYDTGSAGYDYAPVIMAFLAPTAGPAVFPAKPRYVNTMKTWLPTEVSIGTFIAALFGQPIAGNCLILSVTDQNTDGRRGAPAYISGVFTA